MTRTLTPPAPVSLAEFDATFEAVKNWGRWGPDDERGTLNYITHDKVAAAVALVRSGRTVSMAIPINKAAGPDNPNPAVHLMSLMHDLPISKSGLSFGMCFLGMDQWLQNPLPAIGDSGLIFVTKDNVDTILAATAGAK